LKQNCRICSAKREKKFYPLDTLLSQRARRQWGRRRCGKKRKKTLKKKSIGGVLNSRGGALPSQMRER